MLAWKTSSWICEWIYLQSYMIIIVIVLLIEAHNIYVYKYDN